MGVSVRYFTDPGCSASWAAEPTVRKLMVEFGSDLTFEWAMGGLARDYLHGHEMDYDRLIVHWLDRAADSGMPIDPRLWTEGPIRTTYAGGTLKPPSRRPTRFSPGSSTMPAVAVT